MKKFLTNIVFIGLLIAVGYYFLKESGYNIDSILNKTKTYDVIAECSNIENLVLTSVTELTVTNNGAKNHKDVAVRVTAYDINGDIIKQKNVRFDRDLLPNSSMSKPITIPAKTEKCNCVILDSNPD